MQADNVERNGWCVMHDSSTQQLTQFRMNAQSLWAGEFLELELFEEVLGNEVPHWARVEESQGSNRTMTGSHWYGCMNHESVYNSPLGEEDIQGTQEWDDHQNHSRGIAGFVCCWRSVGNRWNESTCIGSYSGAGGAADEILEEDCATRIECWMRFSKPIVSL